MIDDMRRPASITISLAAFAAAAALLLWAAMACSISGSFPNGGYNVVITLQAIVLGFVGVSLAISGLILLLRRRPHA